MKRPRFGKDEPAPTREELEREAARELERMTRQAGGPATSGGASGWSSAPRPPDSGPSSFQPRFGGGTPTAPPQASVRERFQAREVEEMEDEENDDDYSEEEMVTELALRDWSERSGRGRSIEDLALPRIDPASVEAQRDRALREFTERQARMERESEAARIQRQAMGLNPPSRAGTVNLTAARPMGMLNLSAKAAGMRGQGSATPSSIEEPTSEASRKPATATAKAKTKKTPKVAATGRSDAGGSGLRIAKKVPRKATGDTLGAPTAKSAARATKPGAAKTKPGPAKTKAGPAKTKAGPAKAAPGPAKAAPGPAKAAPGPAKSRAVAPRAPGKAAKIAGKTVAGKTVAGKAAKATAKPAAEPIARAAKAVTKAPKAAAKAVGKATKASRGREEVSAANVTPAKKKKAPAAAPAKVSPTPRKGSGRR